MLTSSCEHLGIALFLGVSEMITAHPPLDHLKREKSDKDRVGGGVLGRSPRDHLGSRPAAW
jgi:hypothetical protein